MLFYFVESFIDVELKEILDDYELNFCHKKCTVETGYKKLPEFTVVFNATNLFHLLGIHKLHTRYTATSWIKAVRNDSFSLNDFSKRPEFKDIIPRIRNYEFFYEIFYQNKVNICVLEKDLKRNTMNLSVVFYKNEQKRIVVLGLRRDKFNNFIPATLHESRNNTYKDSRQTVVKGITWHN